MTRYTDLQTLNWKKPLDQFGWHAWTACVVCFSALFLISHYSIFITSGWILARSGLASERSVDGGLLVVVRAFSRSTTGVERPIGNLRALLKQHVNVSRIDFVDVRVTNATMHKPFKRRVLQFIPIGADRECFAGGLNMIAGNESSIKVGLLDAVSIHDRWLYSALAKGGGYLVCSTASSLPPRPLEDAVVLRLPEKITLRDVEDEVRLRLARAGVVERRVARIELTGNPRLWGRDGKPISVPIFSIIGPLALTAALATVTLQFTGSWIGYAVRRRADLLQSFGYDKHEQLRHCLSALLRWDYILLFSVGCAVGFSAMLEHATIAGQTFPYFLAWLAICAIATLLTTTIRLVLCVK